MKPFPAEWAPGRQEAGHMGECDNGKVDSVLSVEERPDET